MGQRVNSHFVNNVPLSGRLGDETKRWGHKRLKIQTFKFKMLFFPETFSSYKEYITPVPKSNKKVSTKVTNQDCYFQFHSFVKKNNATKRALRLEDDARRRGGASVTKA